MEASAGDRDRNSSIRASTRGDAIEAAVLGVLVQDFPHEDRKDDRELPVGAIQEAIKAGGISHLWAPR